MNCASLKRRARFRMFRICRRALNAPCSAGTPWKKCLISKKANDLPLANHIKKSFGILNPKALLLYKMFVLFCLIGEFLGLLFFCFGGVFLIAENHKFIVKKFRYHVAGHCAAEHNIVDCRNIRKSCREIIAQNC